MSAALLKAVCHAALAGCGKLARYCFFEHGLFPQNPGFPCGQAAGHHQQRAGLVTDHIGLLLRGQMLLAQPPRQ